MLNPRFKGMDPYVAYQDRREPMTQDVGGARKPRACARSFNPQLWSMRQSLKETLVDLGDRVERKVRLAYPNAEGDITDDLTWDSFMARLGEGAYGRCRSLSRASRMAGDVHL